MFLALRRTAVWFGRPTRTREQYSRRTSACAPWFCARPRPLACGQPSRKFCRPHCGILCPATPRISRLQTYSRSCSFSYVNLPVLRAYISYLKILQPFWHVAKNNPKIRRHRGNIIGSQMCPATDLFGDVRFQYIFGESQANHSVFGALARCIWESYVRHQVKNLILG